MPEHGPGSLARVGRRVAALCVDWFASTMIAAGLLGYRLGEGGLGPFKPLAVFVVMNLLLVGTLGQRSGTGCSGFVCFASEELRRARFWARFVRLCSRWSFRP